MVEPGPPGGRRWNRPGWQSAAEAWISAVLEERGVNTRGPVQRVRTRFWSVHLAVPTDEGRFWFKENCPLQSFEARLVAAAGRVAGDQLVEAVATEPDEGWLLTRDQGTVVDDTDLARDAATFEQLLSTWGSAQRAILAAELDLSRLGVTTMAPGDAVAYLLGQIERLHGLPDDDAGRLGDSEFARLQALVREVERWVDTVLATGLPLTLDHSDLHLGNAFADPTTGRLRIFDLSDAVISFPLCTLLVPLRAMLRDDADRAADPPAVRRVVDAHLEVFSDLVSMRELRAAVPAALELAKLNRCESWRRALDGADANDYAESGGAPAAWLGLLGTDPLL